MNKEATVTSGTLRSAVGEVPDHLPPKLSISFWHHWLYRAQPGAPYADLERCVLGLKERGFNTVRVNVPLTYAFRLDGTPRGPIEFEQPVPGYGKVIDGGAGGGRPRLTSRLCAAPRPGRSRCSRVFRGRSPPATILCPSGAPDNESGQTHTTAENRAF